MKCAWIISEALDIVPTKTYRNIKDIAPIWGSWSTWREFNTDNCICTDIRKAEELLGKAFQGVTHLHIPKQYYEELGKPRGVKLFEGKLKTQMPKQDDVAALSIASQQYDILLLLGFDLSSDDANVLQTQAIIAGNPQCQFVAIDLAKPLSKIITDCANFTCDEYENVLHLLT